MSFSTAALQPATNPVSETPANNDLGAPLLGLLLLSVYAAHKSRKAFRKMKRKLLWQAFKMKLSSPFSAGSVSDRTLIYILLAVALLALLLIEPVLVLVLVLVVLILYLAGVIQF